MGKEETTNLIQKNFPPNTTVYINESLCSYYNFLWSECKKLWSKKSIASFWVSIRSIRIKESENVTAILVSHINDLVKHLSIDVSSRDRNEGDL